MSKYFTGEYLEKFIPRLAENRAMMAFAANCGCCVFVATSPAGAYVLSAMSWGQCAGTAAAWGAATLTAQRYFARGYHKIYVENKLKYEVGHHLAGQTVVVTGASSGIGYELAVRLAQNGCETVIMACRNKEKTEAAIKNAGKHVRSLRNQIVHWREPQYRSWESKHSERLKFMELDLSDEASIEKFVKELSYQYPKVDMLVNNAGTFAENKNVITNSGHELQLATNALGPFMLTELMLPMVERRIVYVTSILHANPSKSEEYDIVGDLDKMQYSAVSHNPRPEVAVTQKSDKEAAEGPSDEELALHQRKEREEAVRYRIQARGEDLQKAKDTALLPYGPSKLINLMHARDLRDRLHGRGVIAVAVHPGGAATDVFREFPVVAALVRLVSPLFFKTPTQAARTVLQCCIADDVKNGAFYADNWPAETRASPLSKSLPQRRSVMDWCSEQWDFKVPLRGSAVMK